MTNFKEDLKNIKAFIFDIDGVLSLQTISLNVFGVPNRTVNLRDGYALHLAVKKGYHVGIISGSNSKEYLKRLKMLGINDIFLNSKTKLEHYKLFRKKFGLNDSEIMFMGDDIPDIKMMKISGISACPPNSVAEVKEISDYISPIYGGKGAVRDVIEQVMKVQGTWIDDDTQSI